jgi:hypothetical protein
VELVTIATNTKRLTAVLVADHLMRIEADLMEAKRIMLLRLQAAARRLPSGDPDRLVLDRCIQDLRESVRRQEER